HCRVPRIFETGMSDYVASIVFLPLKESQAYFNRAGDVTAIEVFVDNPDRIGGYKKPIVDAAQRPIYTVDWRQRNRTYFSALQVERNVMFVILTLIILVAALSILSALGDIVEEMDRFPAEFGDFLDRLGSEFWCCNIEKNVGARRLEVNHLGINRRVGGLIGHLGHDFHLAVEPVFQALEVVLAIIIILVEDADLSLRVVLQQILSIDVRFALVIRLPAHGPREVLRIVPLGGARRNKELRHLLGVHVFLDRGVGRRPQRL